MALRTLEQRARRRFGQHFLTRSGVVERIVRASGVEPGEPVVEIGPGLGILTRALVQAGAQVTAIEVDRDLAGWIREHFPQVRLIEADATAVDWDEVLGEEAVRMVANLPYNVGTGLVMGALRRPDRFRSVTVMLQSEVVERLVARPGTKAYGSLSVEAWLWAEGRAVMGVPPEAFHPPPKVRSAVVRFDRPQAPRAPGLGEEAVERVVRAAFSQRRKTLRNNLKAFAPLPEVDRALASIGASAQVRAEALEPAAFVALASALKTHSPSSEGAP